MLAYDLQRYYPDFIISVVYQVLENVHRGLEVRAMMLGCIFVRTLIIIL